MKKRLLVAFLCCGILTLNGCSNDSGTEKKMEQEERNLEEDSEAPAMEVDQETVNKKSTDVEAGIGEGTSSMEIQELTDSLEYKVGEKISVKSDASEYELQIDSVKYTDKRNNHEQTQEKVILIEYTYKNLSDEPLMVGDVRFQLTDKEQSKVYEPYYFTEQKAAEPAEKDQSVTAQVAFAQDDDSKEFSIVYTDISSGEAEPILIKIDKIEEG